MKFGKQLVKASRVSMQLCEPQLWLDYKRLKKLLKNIDTKFKKVEISNSADERKFFTLLKSELAKVSKTFVRLQQRIVDKTAALQKLDTNLEDSDALSLRLKAMTNLHLSLILLESYAVLNHVGFRKILKKHDKLTGFDTTEKYMKKVVGQELFSKHYWIRETLFSIEEEFAAIKKKVLEKGKEKELSSPKLKESAKVRKRKREEECDYDKHKEKYIKEFEHHQQQYESMEDIAKGFLTKRQASGPEEKVTNEVEDKAGSSDHLKNNDDRQASSRKEEARIALESLALAAEAHSLLSTI